LFGQSCPKAAFGVLVALAATVAISISASAASATVILPADSYGEQGFTSGHPTTLTPPTNGIDRSTTEGAQALTVTGTGFTGQRCHRAGSTRSCTYYTFGTAYRVCTFGPGHRRRCRALHHSSSARPSTAAARVAKIATASSSTAAPYGFRQPLPAVGKIFRRNDYEENGEATGHCSGTLIASGLVITAAHCLYASDQEAAETFAIAPGKAGSIPGFLIEVEELLFVPDASATGTGSNAASNVSAPYGTLKIVQTWVPSCWHEGNDDGACDYGVAEIQPYSDGTYAGQKVGAFPLLWNYSAAVGSGFYQMGYPASGSFRTQQYQWGDAPAYCTDTFAGQYRTSANTPQDASLIGNGYYIENPRCFMNGGASGGPVFTQYQGKWYVNGVNNIGLNDSSTGFGVNMSWNWWGSAFGNFLCGVAPTLCGSS
jgi:hypothetical protein